MAMMYCPYCGQPILDGTIYCAHCGKVLRPTSVKNDFDYRRTGKPRRHGCLSIVLRILLLILLCVIVGVIIFAVSRFTSGSDGEQVDPDSSAIHDDQSEEEPSQRADGEMPEADSGQADGDAAGAAPETPPAEEAEAGYVFGSPLPESEAVDDSWFSDAVFLGDSRTEGLQLYSGITTGTFFWEWGMSVFKIDDTGHRKVAVNGEKMTLMEALSTGTWSKVYIMMGINDLGYPAQSYQEALGKMVDRVREIQSSAVIYLQTMPPVNDVMAQQNGLAYYVNTENVNAFNEAIVQVAKEKQVVLLDTASCLTDSQGQLIADISSDGVHFKKAGYQTWLDYLKCHTISPEEIPQ